MYVCIYTAKKQQKPGKTHSPCWMRFWGGGPLFLAKFLVAVLCVETSMPLLTNSLRTLALKQQAQRFSYRAYGNDCVFP